MARVHEQAPSRSYRNRQEFVRRKERELEGLRPDIHDILSSQGSPTPAERGELLTTMERTLGLLGRLRRLAERPLRRRQERILWYRTRLRFRELAGKLHEGVRSLRRQIQ